MIRISWDNSFLLRGRYDDSPAMMNHAKHATFSSNPKFIVDTFNCSVALGAAVAEAIADYTDVGGVGT